MVKRLPKLAMRMPSISDPGHELVTACLEEELAVIALPGPTAGMTALIASGLYHSHLRFMVLPRKKKEQKDVLSALKEERPTQIFMSPLSDC